MKTTLSGGTTKLQGKMTVLAGILLAAALGACQSKPESAASSLYDENISSADSSGWEALEEGSGPTEVAEAASAAPTPATAGGTVDATAMLAAHNRWRSGVGVPPLRWSDKLAGIAQGWADHLTSNGCSMYHSGNGYGENIYQASALMWSDGRNELQKKTPQHVTDSWGSEVKFYNYADNSCSGVCGHYTQLVWKTTTEVGCAMSVCGNNSQIWVCSYYPAGNFVGQKPY
jgi:pathogenesis-related protein 1